MNVLARYARDFSVNYCDLDMAGYLSPVSVFRYMEETACAHTDAWGIGMDILRARGEGWIMHTWYLAMARYPRRHARVTVTTWPFRAHHFQGIREFLLADEEGEIGRATSLWIYVNLKKSRPMRIPEDVLSYHTPGERLLPYDFPSLPRVNEVAVKAGITAGLFQIDTNQHVNNVHYIEWMLSSVTPEFYREHRLSTLEVVYNTAAHFGDHLAVVSGHPVFCEGKTEIIHQIESADGGKALTQARSLWVPVNNKAR